MCGTGTIIRPSRDEDVPAIAAIYGHHVQHGVASFEEVPPPPDEIAHRRGVIAADNLPYLVAEHEGKVVGYCYASRFRPRSGYRYTLEDSVYVAPGHIGRGIGRSLLDSVLARCEALGYRQMVAVIGGRETAASIGLHQALGFSHAGILSGVGYKFGRWVDIVLMQRPLGPGTVALPE
jgi:L-amino acid N-acyltransferase YncA